MRIFVYSSPHGVLFTRCYLALLLAYHYSLLMIYSAQLALMSGIFEKPEIKAVVNID